MTVAVSLIRAVVNELERQGCDPAPVLADARISSSELEQPSSRIDGYRYDRLQLAALEASGDPAFGLHMGEHASVSAFSVLGHMIVQCRTLRQVLEILFRYYRLIAEIDPPHLVEEGDRARIVYEYLRSSEPLCNRMRAEFGLVRVLTMARAFVGADTRAEEVWFEHAKPDAPEHAAEYRRLFAGTELFAMPQTGVVISRALLDATQIHHDASLLELMRVRADRMLADLGQELDLAQKIHELIVREYVGVHPTQESIAQHLGLSTRSLRRRLRSEQIDFTEVVRIAMGQLAGRKLVEASGGIQGAAFVLGFADVSSFHRAFKRWTGTTPNRYLEQHRDDAPPETSSAADLAGSPLANTRGETTDRDRFDPRDAESHAHGEDADTQGSEGGDSKL